MKTAFRAIAAAGLIAFSTAAGCDGPQKSPPNDHAGRVVPSRADLLTPHRDRIAKLATVKSSGVIELRWSDEAGDRHFEQGDIRLFMQLPDQVSLQIHKLGDTLLWLGASGDSYWLFDLLNDDDKVLYRGSLDEAVKAGATTGALHPQRLLDLFGLCALEGEGPVRGDEERKAWVVEGSGQGGAMRLFFDWTTGLPRRVESLDEAGRVLYASDLSEYESLPVLGLPPGAHPKWPMRAHIVETGRDGVAHIAFGEPTTAVDPKQLRNACDVNRLTANLRPHRVEAPAGGGSAGSR